MEFRLSPEAIRYAQTVAEVGSFGAAARVHHVTQPALSNSIATLERQLGSPLFVRSPSGTTITPLGARLIPLIDDAVAALDSVVAEARRWSLPAQDTVQVGVSPLIDFKLVTRMYEAFSSHLEVVIREADLADLREELAAGELDLIVVPSVAPMPRFERYVVDSEPIVFVGAGNSRADRVELADLTENQWILVPDSCGLTVFTRDLIEGSGLQLKTYPGEAASYRVLEDWSRMGLGSALLPQSKLSTHSSNATAVYDDGIQVEIFYEVIWDPTSILAERFRSLVDQIARSA